MGVPENRMRGVTQVMAGGRQRGDLGLRTKEKLCSPASRVPDPSAGGRPRSILTGLTAPRQRRIGGGDARRLKGQP